MSRLPKCTPPSTIGKQQQQGSVVSLRNSEVGGYCNYLEDVIVTWRMHLFLRMCTWSSL